MKYQILSLSPTTVTVMISNGMQLSIGLDSIGYYTSMSSDEFIENVGRYLAHIQHTLEVPQYDLLPDDVISDIVQDEHDIPEPDESYQLQSLNATIRNERNHRLMSTDWTQLPDAPLSKEKKREWIRYRQLLRDMTKTEDLSKAEWPTPPQ